MSFQSSALPGGAEQFAFQLTKRLAENPAFDIHVFANQWKSEQSPITFHKIPILSFPKWLTTISFAYLAGRSIAAENFDLIHTHDRIFHADLCTVHSLPHRYWLQNIRKKPFLSLFDLATEYTEKRLFRDPVRHSFLPVSSLAPNIIVNEFPQVVRKIRILSPGVNLPESPGVSTKRSAFGFSENDFILLFVGMNFELKGLDNIMAAFSRALQKSPKPLKLLVTGKGDVAKYTALARKLHIHQNIVFAGTRDDMENIYSEGDALIMLSQFDTFGMVALEAMANSLPVLISRNVGAVDLVEDGTNGFIVSNENTDAISQKILLLLNGAAYRRMSIASHKTAVKHSWDLKARQLAEIYQDVLQHKALLK